MRLGWSTYAVGNGTRETGEELVAALVGLGLTVGGTVLLVPESQTGAMEAVSVSLMLTHFLAAS